MSIEHTYTLEMDTPICMFRSTTDHHRSDYEQLLRLVEHYKKTYPQTTTATITSSRDGVVYQYSPDKYKHEQREVVGV